MQNRVFLFVFLIIKYAKFLHNNKLLVSDHNNVYKSPNFENNMKRICIWGDSITWGARLPFRAGWANLFRNYLENISEEYIAIYDLGIDGNTSEDILNRFDGEAKARSPEIIIFAIGTNDSHYKQNNHKFPISIKDFENNLMKIVEKAKKISTEIIFIGLAKGNDNL